MKKNEKQACLRTILKEEHAHTSGSRVKIFGWSLLSTTLLASGAYAQSFTILNVQTVGQQTLTIPSDVGTVDAGGTISAMGDGIIDAGAVDSLTVLNNGSIVSGANGVNFDGNSSDLTNNGDIAATVNGLRFQDGSFVTNSGTITANDDGLDGQSSNTITNNGTISSTGSGTVFDNNSIEVEDNNTVTNNGTLISADDAIDANDTNTLVNSATGIINAGDDGFDIDDGNNVTNHGTITAGDRGIEADDDLTATNSGTISAGDDGILGQDNGFVDNSGTVTTTSGGTGNVAVDLNDGTVINSGTLDGGIGIQFDNGIGTVISSGAITGRAGTALDFALGAFDDQATLQTGSTTIGNILLKGGSDTLTSDGRIVGDILADTGDDSATFTSNSTTVGQILMGDGSDLVTFSGGDFSGVTLFDGGDDTGNADGFVDVLTFTGTSGALTSANVINWENVVIGAGSTISFTDNLLVAGALQTNASGVLNAAGGFSLTGALTNNGIVSTRNGAVGDIVAVSGNYSGSGQLQVDVDFTSDTADSLQIAADVTGGTTAIAVTDVSTGLASGNDVLVVDVAGTTSAGDFALANGPVASGAFSYDLALIGSQFFLSSIGVNGTGAVYEATPSVLLGFTDLPTLEQRVGQRQWLSRDSERDPVQPREGVWLRLHGDRFVIRPDSSTSGLNYDTQRWGIQFGADVAIDEGDSGYWVFGVTGQYDQIDADIANTLGNGDIDADGFGVGATATWYGNSGTYFDAQAQLNWIDTDFSSSTNGNLGSDISSKAYALSVEVGHRYKLDEQNALVPQAQLTWSGWDGDDFTDSTGNAVDFNSETSLIGRIGLAYEHEYTEGFFFGDHSPSAGYAGHREKIYVIGNILHQFVGSTTVGVSGSNLSLENQATWAEIGLGGSIVWDEDKTLYLEAAYSTSLDGGGDSHAYGLTTGFRMVW
jgi:outer membrane autotransporter protein